MPKYLSIRRKGQMATVPTIVIIEDQEFTERVIRAALRHRPFNIVTATDGEDGLHVVEELSPELVLLDISLPKMNGWEVLRRIRASERLADTPVVIITAQGRVEAETRSLELGGDELLTKPFLVRELRNAVDAALARSAA